MRGGILKIFLSFRKGVGVFKDFSFLCDDHCSVVHHFHCGENLLVAFKRWFNFFSCSCEYKGDRYDVFVVFEYNLRAVFNISHDITFMRHIVGWVEINENFLTFAFLFVFLCRVWTGSLGVIAFGSEGGFASSINRRMSTRLSF